jgi:hypothetical protein
MRLSDAGIRRRKTKLIDPNHRLTPFLSEDATRDRSSRWLAATGIPQVLNVTVELRVLAINGDGPIEPGNQIRIRFVDRA